MEYWFEYVNDEKKLTEKLNKRFNQMKEDMEYCHTQSQIYQNYYDNTFDDSFPLSFNSRGRGTGVIKSKFAYNMITPIVQDIHNRMAKIKPKPTFINNNFLFSHKSKIKRIDMFVLKMLKKGKFYKMFKEALIDGQVRDIGILKTFPEKGKVKCYKVDIKNFYCINPYEGKTRRDEVIEKHKISTYMLYKRFWKGMTDESKNKFKEKFCDLKEPKIAIEKDEFQNQMLEVTEIFKKGKRHVIWFDEIVFLNEAWNYDFIPYDFSYWNFPQNGIIGKGIPDILSGLQKRLNVLLKKISKSLDLSMYPVILAHITANVGQKFNNQRGNIVEWSGAVPPTSLTQPITHEQVFVHFYHIIDMCYQSVRLNQRAVAGETPRGADGRTGIAIQNAETTDQARFFSPAELYEDMVVSIAKKIAIYGYEKNIDGLKDKLEDFKEFFDNVETWPTSIIPYTPEGRVQRAETLINIGLYTPEEVADVYDFPDVSNQLSSKGARIAAIWAMLEKSVLSGEGAVPDEVLGYPEQNDIATRLYAKLRMEDEDKYQDALDRLTDFLDKVGAELKRIEMERMQMAMSQSMPQESPDPERGGGAVTDQAVVQGSGISKENQASQMAG